jgi:hypothetical protein
MRFEQLIAGALVALVCALGCKRKDAGGQEASTTKASTTNTVAAAQKPSASARGKDGKQPYLEPLPGGTVSVLKGHKPKTFQVPIGPMLGIIPGKGVGPIRFGATVETVERLMQSKCAEKTESVCRYSAQAIDFHFTDGALSEIRIQGDERPFSDKPGVTYGVFNGRFAGGAALGMYSQFVIESLGEPKRKENVQPGGNLKTMERHYYEDMVLEYDKLENGNVVLAGVVLKRPDDGAGATKPSAADPQ